jgi:HK97 family phage portal protein
VNIVQATTLRVRRALTRVAKSFVTALTPREVFGIVREPFTGAWQRNLEVDNRACILAFSAVYSCVAIVSSDFGKLPCNMTEQTRDKIWRQVDRNSPFMAVLEKPNRYQTRIQFFAQWAVSLMLYGNTYVLKERDQRGIVTEMYVLPGDAVRPMVCADGSIYYQISSWALCGLPEGLTVPASEIIHARINCLWHPLVGVSPIYACGAAATQGNRIQNQASRFFENMSRPSGMLTAPGNIDDETAARLKHEFESKLGGANIGRLLVAGSGIDYKAMTMPAVDAQLVEQLHWTVEDVARCFRVPLYMLDAGPIPTHSNIEAMARMYYAQTLQAIIEDAELLLEEGLELNKNTTVPYAVEFDLTPLLRMDTAARYATYEVGVRAAVLSPNDARFMENLPPVEGGESPMSQQQNFSLAALAKRDAQDNPFATATPGAAAPAPAAALPEPDANAPPASAADTTVSEEAKALTRYDIIARTVEYTARELATEIA